MSGKEKTNGSLAMAPRVITIPAASQENTRKLRVAAYARVSSNSEDQKHSFAAQNAYYSKLITDNPDWELADIYADQGITGISIDKRDDFLRMMEDCRKGRIDRILVKSSSRFARNTKESLEAVRELAALGVSVYFEEQNIDTAQVSGEVLIAMFAALAQRESEAISGRTRWGIQRCMEQGRFTPTAIPLGYRKDKAGNIFIDEEQVKYIRIIFKEFLDGKNSRDIAAALDMEQKKLGQVQGAYRWTYGAVIRILRNEKYTGNSIWQKTYRTDDLSHRKVINRGQKKRFYAKETHPPIIDKVTFEKAQRILDERQRKFFDSHAGASLLQGKIKCGKCGSNFRKVVSGGIAYQVCRNHAQRKELCSVRQIPESAIYAAFLRLHYQLKYNGSSVLTQLISDLHAARTGSLLWSENIVEINKQISDIASQERLLTQLKQQGSVDPDIFISRGNLLAERRRELKLQKERILRSEEDHTIQQTQDMLDVLESGPDWLDDFDEQLFSDMVEKIVVVDNETLCFRLLNGLEVTEKIERTQR